jgi:hypothetical protein
MIKLSDILLEIETESIDFSPLSRMDDIVKDELEDAQKEEPVNEIIGLTTGAFLLALPGMVNGIFRIIKAIKDKAPPKYNLSKPGDNKSHIDFVIAFTDKMDGYLDTPFKVMLTPFIKDSIKRDKVAKIIKAIALLIMSLGIDITKSPDIMSVGKELVGDKFTDLATSRTTADIITKVKPIIKTFLS